VSVNGHVTFDTPLAGFPPSLSQINRPMVAVLYGRFRRRTPKTRGVLGVERKERAGVYALESTDYRLLTRADLNIRDRFRDQAFHASSVLVVTYDSVVDVSGKVYSGFGVEIWFLAKNAFFCEFNLFVVFITLITNWVFCFAGCWILWTFYMFQDIYTMISRTKTCFWLCFSAFSSSNFGCF